MSSVDDKVDRFVVDAGYTPVLVNQIDRVLEIVECGLDRLTPSVGSAREISHEAMEASKLGLEITKLVLNRLKSF